MSLQVNFDWQRGVDITTLVIAFLSLLAAFGIFRRERFLRSEKKTLEKEIDQLNIEAKKYRHQIKIMEKRLGVIDPDRVRLRISRLSESNDFSKAVEEAEEYLFQIRDDFEKISEILAEQAILESDQSSAVKAEEAARAINLGLAVKPESRRLIALSDLLRRRLQGIQMGEPVEALALDGKSASELLNLSKSLMQQGKFIEAELAARRAVPQMLTEVGANSPDYTAALAQHGLSLKQVGETDGAVDRLKLALEIDQQILGPGDFRNVINLNNLAGAIRDQGNHSSAMKLYEEARQMSVEFGHTDSASYAKILDNIAKMYTADKRYDEAEELLRKAIEIDKRTVGTRSPDYCTQLNNLGMVLLFKKNLIEAEKVLTEAAGILVNLFGENSHRYAIALAALASLEVQKECFETAEAHYRKVLSILDQLYPPGAPFHLETIKSLARCLRQSGKPEEARDFVVAVVTQLREKLPKEHPAFGELDGLLLDVEVEDESSGSPD